MPIEFHQVHQSDPAHYRGDVIFVHGLDGGARNAWQVGDRPDLFWPAWLGEDLPDRSIWTLAYQAPVSERGSAASPLVDLATGSLSVLEAYAIGRRPLLFVAHSLGGLLVKQMLRHATSYGNEGWGANYDQVRGIVFLATPHAGASAANWFWHLDSPLRTPVSGKELDARTSQLRDLNLWFRSHVEQTGIQLQVYYEQRPTHGMQVIDPTSADPGIVGVTPIMLDADHVSIAKLQDRSDLLYPPVRRFGDEYCRSEPPSKEAGDAI